MADVRAENLANWDGRVPGHVAEDGYGADMERLATDPDFLSGVVRFDRQALAAAGLSDLTGMTLLHSQCHIGTDSVSWGKLGATVTGIDFAPQAIVAAQALSDRMGLDGTFLLTDFYDAPDVLDQHYGPGHQFDIVYTSVGAICWLPDIVQWGAILGARVRPGGVLYIRDTHPALATLDDERDDEQLVLKYPAGRTLSFTTDVSYSGSATLDHRTSHEWLHPLSTVINAIIDGGLVIERVDELTHLDFKYVEHMETFDTDYFRLPESQRDLVPTQFSVLARKPLG